MADTVYCYCCRTHHPREQMRRYPTRHGFRWRCLRTIDAARRPPAERDEFGRQTTSQNRDQARRMADLSTVRCLYPLEAGEAR